MSNIKYKVIWVAMLSFFLTNCTHRPSESLRDPAAEVNLPRERVVYEHCTHEKLYLEEQMNRMPSEYFQTHPEDQPKRIPISCIKYAQKNYRGSYGICESEMSFPKISRVKPCLTENYVMLVYNAYHDVLNCFELDPADFYLQIMNESGFHLNAINATGFDSGLSQFTGRGIKKVISNNLVEQTRTVLLASSRKSCQRISSIVGAFSVEGYKLEERCSMLTLPSNPYRAMLFNYLHMRSDKKEIEGILADMPEIADAVTPKIVRQLIFLAYNRGLTGVRRLLEGYIESRRKVSHQITTADLDLNQNLTKFKKEFKTLSPAMKQRLKTVKMRDHSFAEYAIIHNASYVSDMTALRDYVQQQFGNSCGEL